MQNYNQNDYWLNSSKNLGGIYPYYNSEYPEYFTLNFSELISYRKANNLPIKLDHTGLVTKMCMRHLLGNRTLIQGVLRAPWMSEYQDNGTWRPHYLPPHGNLVPNKSSFTTKLKAALLDEAKGYIKDKKNIGILLSGGMDSRVLAGIIREL